MVLSLTTLARNSKTGVRMPAGIVDLHVAIMMIPTRRPILSPIQYVLRLFNRGVNIITCSLYCQGLEFMNYDLNIPFAFSQRGAVGCALLLSSHKSLLF
jgi:hypothetical protein